MEPKKLKIMKYDLAMLIIMVYLTLVVSFNALIFLKAFVI